MKRFISICFIFIITITVLGCHKETEQAKVKKVITDIQTAAEEKDVKEIINNLSKTYSDSHGSHPGNYQKAVARIFLSTPEDISLYQQSKHIH